MSLISVVIPVYNRAHVVRESIKSVQQQSIKDWEIIVVDDGSKDNSAEVLDALASEDLRIRVVRQTNQGAQAARNAGIKAARGEWIAFLDSDDRFLPNSLESRLKTAEEEKVQVVASSCLKIDSDGKETVYSDPLRGNVYRSLLKAPTVTFPGLLVAKAALEKIGYLDEGIRAYQEWDTAIRLARYFRFGFVETPTFIYDCRGTDTISTQFIRAGQGYDQIVRKHFINMVLRIGPMGIARHYRAIAEWYRHGKEFAAQEKFLWQARFYDFFKPIHKLKKIVVKKLGNSNS